MSGHVGSPLAAVGDGAATNDLDACVVVLENPARPPAAPANDGTAANSAAREGQPNEPRRDEVDFSLPAAAGEG